MIGRFVVVLATAVPALLCYTLVFGQVAAAAAVGLGLDGDDTLVQALAAFAACLAATSAAFPVITGYVLTRNPSLAPLRFGPYLQVGLALTFPVAWAYELAMISLDLALALWMMAPLAVFALASHFMVLAPRRRIIRVRY